MPEKPRVIICQGPPRCDYDDAKPDRDLPCPWCRVEEVEADGSLTIIQEPASA